MKLYEIIALLSLVFSIFSSRRSPLFKAAALAGLAVSAAVIRWLLAHGSSSVRSLVLGLGMLAIAAVFWVDYKKGRDSVGLLVVFTLLFGLLPLAALIRVLVFEPDQIPFLKDSLVLCVPVLPAGISCCICLVCTLRRKKRERSALS